MEKGEAFKKRGTAKRRKEGQIDREHVFESTYQLKYELEVQFGCHQHDLLSKEK